MEGKEGRDREERRGGRERRDREVCSEKLRGAISCGNLRAGVYLCPSSSSHPNGEQMKACM